MPKKKAEPKDETKAGDNALGLIGSFVERVERLEEEKKAIADDIKDVYAEAKGRGLDPKVMKKLVAERKQDAEKVREFQEILKLYREALARSGEGGESE